MCSGCRPTQAQHNASISRTASVSLLDILCQVPPLSEFMTPDSTKALSATCKSLRLQFIAQVQIVTVVRKENCALVFERRWPRLCMVISQHEDADYTLSQPSSLTRIVNVQISAASNIRAAVSMLRPLHHLATDLPWMQLAAQQLAHQMRIRWPLMFLFTMSNVHDLDGLGSEIVSQLVKGTWTHLIYLNLSECKLRAQAFLLLSQGNWPSLIHLNVSGNCLDAEGMAWLAKGNWPWLTHVTLSFYPSIAAIAHLSAANWQTSNLVIKDTLFSAGMAAELADLRLANLSELHLKGSGLTAAAVSELARADWPSLETLCLDHDDLDAIAVLLGVDLKKVQELQSDESIFAVSEQRMPDVVLWPNLSWITVSKGKLHLTL